MWEVENEEGRVTDSRRSAVPAPVNVGGSVGGGGQRRWATRWESDTGCSHPPPPPPFPLSSVGVEDEAREGAVLVAVAPVGFAAVQLDEDLVAGVQVEDDAVAGVVVALVLVLGDGAGPDLETTTKREGMRRGG